ncbi:MAG: ribonucleoside-diphosphate reductase beta chain [Thermoleophilaceae bacterium]|nr:ribonucleoside-diphosphate reductase beta chain [Thermoleophilaceae bacterium]
MDRTREALREMARVDPELAARLVLQALPAAAAKLPPPLAYDITVDGLGTWRVVVDEHGSSVARANGNGHVNGNGNGNGNGSDAGAGRPLDFRLITDAQGLALMAAGGSPVRLMLGGKVRIRGKRRRAIKLRAMAEGETASLGDAIRAGAELDTDAVFRSLPYLIDPAWTAGHTFSAAYEVEGVGRWVVHVDDGQRLRVDTDGQAATTMRMGPDTYRDLITGDITPAQSIRSQRTQIEGPIYPATMLGRWIDRSQGRDDDELRREAAQREVQARREGIWGAATPKGGDLLDYRQLYALWERQNWRVHELDFSVDREHWLASPTEAQENMLWSLGSFYIGEERVTADLAPFVRAAPTGEIESFLATQLVDEARHAVFFDRYGAEVLALDAEDLRGRMLEVQSLMLPAWYEVFDGGLRDVAERIQARPDDFDLFVDGITVYHLIIEGVLATTGQRTILDYSERHDIYPGFCEGFGLVERDEHRHIAFGVRFLRDAVADDHARGEIVMRRVCELVPKAVHVFCPPYVDGPEEFVSYGYHSSQIYGFAYRRLKRRMQVIGLECPPPEDLMPGPIASPEEARAAGVPV